LTPDQIEKAGKQLYGEHWQSALARRLRVDARTVRRWIAGDRQILGPAIVAIELLLKYPKER
jgi:DNA-binding transcriptional regulator YiaG